MEIIGSRFLHREASCKVYAVVDYGKLPGSEDELETCG
jgi:hypothetical protein